MSDSASDVPVASVAVSDSSVVSDSSSSSNPVSEKVTEAKPKVCGRRPVMCEVPEYLLATELQYNYVRFKKGTQCVHTVYEYLAWNEDRRVLLCKDCGQLGNLRWFSTGSSLD